MFSTAKRIAFHLSGTLCLLAAYALMCGLLLYAGHKADICSAKVKGFVHYRILSPDESALYEAKRILGQPLDE